MAEQLTAASSAARSRRYRQRQREGLRVVSLPVYEDYAAALTDYGFLDEANANDREKVAEAIGELLFCLTQGVVEIDLDHLDQIT